MTRFSFNCEELEILGTLTQAALAWHQGERGEFFLALKACSKKDWAMLYSLNETLNEPEELKEPVMRLNW